ncbi:proteasome assembly chaperone family protein [Amnibacterium kyonggiense]|uniref:PAC2 family protein n=1 Tax=Amnibacterium kyonggiense TaxID=595671 RepID=A0A4R7FMG6_9MICO|nr:PAC2 family protein [Amnibacterium kyonggiense]TDS77528.1 PAC2 family protein [Amnibacterium kyonggiense]
MREPEDLYELTPDAADVPQGLPLVAGLTGFADAGGAVQQLAEYFADNASPTPIAVFDTDELLDYRARRPVIEFDEDHIASFTTSSLELSLCHDEIGRPFLLLSGFEPDFQWNRFTAAVIGLIERFGVTSTTWVQAIPMPVPHTRPLQVTVGGNRQALIDSMSAWRPTTRAPSNVLHLLEFRLAEQDREVAEFVLLIPHYLADTELPAAVAKGLEVVSAATGLLFAIDPVRDRSRDFTARVDEQVAGNAELEGLVRTLEERHDAYMAGNPVRSPLTDVEGEVPSADELAAELEKFLALRRSNDDEA